MKRLLLYFLLGASASGAFAQDESSASSHPLVPPPGPLIQKRAPDFSSWTVTLKLPPATPATGAAANAPQSPEDPKKIITITTMTKTGNIIRAELTDEQKRVWNIWLYGGQEVLAYPDGKSVEFTHKAPGVTVNPFYMDFSQSDFQGFDWISPANYTGIQEVAGRQCLVFKDTVINGFLSSPSVAAIDLKTRLPVQLENIFGLTDYEFQAASVPMQELPANVQKLITGQQQKEASLASRPGPAF